MKITPVIHGCQGTSLTQAELDFFIDSQPVGLIIFSRNVESKHQLKSLTQSFLNCIDHPFGFVMVDQEGGRVQRLAADKWCQWPSALTIGNLYKQDRYLGQAMARACAMTIATELNECGIAVNAAPVLDLLFSDSHQVIGDRSFGEDVEQIIDLGRVMVDAYIASGIMPIVKHIPGHGRAMSDSHTSLPSVDASEAQLVARDAKPFIALAETPAAMVSHLLYTALDSELPLTFSAKGIAWLRQELGYSGLLFSDCLHMNALTGNIAQRAQRALHAGLDLVIDSHSLIDDKVRVQQAVGQVRPDTIARLELAWHSFSYGEEKPDEQDWQLISRLKSLSNETDPTEIFVK